MRKQHNSAYILFSLIKSEVRKDLDLNSYHLAILLVMVRYLSMKGKFCCLNNDDFAKEAGMSTREFIRKRQYLINNNVILCYEANGRKYYDFTDEFKEIVIHRCDQ